MKKSLVLAMAMALGVTASAYAANPFSDVPAGHWAYDSIDKLAAAGVIDGMGDGTYQGAKTMTRYEMAQIVAKAMAKGAADLEKLQAEFAEELNNLGVRVAALEKKSDNVTITGAMYYTYAHRQDGSKNDKTVEKNRLRTRLFLNGQINEDWSYGARLQNDETVDNGADDTTFSMNRAWVDGRVGGLKVTAGKFGTSLGGGNLYTETMEAIRVSYGKKVVGTAYIGNLDCGANTNDDVWGIKVATKFGKLDVAAELNSFKAENGKNGGKAKTSAFGVDNKVYSIAATYKFDKNVSVDYTYLNADADGEDGSVGQVLGVNYKGAKASQPGSWGVWAKYMNQGHKTFVGATHAWDPAGDIDTIGNVQGYSIGADYALAKNIVYNVNYTNLDQKGSGKSLNVIWNNLTFSF